MSAPPLTALTAEEFFQFCQHPDHRDKRFELEGGEIVAMSLPGERHCAVCGNVTGVLWAYTRQRRQGYVCPNDMGIIFERDPDTVRGPDVAVYTEARRYEDLTARFTDRLPTLIVEVLSPHDQLGRMMRRINHFLNKGVAMVWLVDPAARNVTVCVANQLPVILEDADMLADFALLPDFRCPVSELFAMPGEEAVAPPPAGNS